MALVTSPDQVMLSCDSLLVAILVAGVYVDLSLVVGHGERVRVVKGEFAKWKDSSAAITMEEQQTRTM